MSHLVRLFFAALPFVAAPASAAVIRPVGVEASSPFFSCDKANLINGSGLLAGLHGNFNNHRMSSTTGAPAPAQLFELEGTARNVRVDLLDNCGDRVTWTGLAEARFAGAVPEPATWALFIAGFGAVGLMARRQRAGLRTGLRREIMSRGRDSAPRRAFMPSLSLTTATADPISLRFGQRRHAAAPRYREGSTCLA
jgi:hypothetical protein